jgi:tRNA 2-thiouridine synthesizing protein A
MTERTIDLRGLKCPLAALCTRKALAGSAPGDILIVECTDPLAGIDIPSLLRETGDALEETRQGSKGDDVPHPQALSQVSSVLTPAPPSRRKCTANRSAP